MPLKCASFAPLVTMALVAASSLWAQGAPAVVGSAAAAPLTTEAIAARAVPATVTIVTFDADGDTLGLGSGFIVRPTGVIVTNHHVMAGAVSAAVVLASGERYDRVQALDTDPGADLAILKIPGYGLPTLATTSVMPRVGAKVVAVGNPLGLSRTVSEGIVSAMRLYDGRELMQMSAAISPGSSGGPVLNARGEVVAVATSYLKVGQSLNFAVPVRYAMGLVESENRPVALKAAFAAVPEEPPASARSAASEGASPIEEARPARTSSPRASISGSYYTSGQIWLTSPTKPPEGPVYSGGILLLGGGDNGLYFWWSDTTGARSRVWFVNSFTTAPDGRIVIEIGGATWNGYQTDKGIFLESALEPPPGKPAYTVQLNAEATTIRLDRPSGLYELDVRTAYVDNGRRSTDPTDWTGDVAIVTVRDSIFVDLWLQNEAGGSVGFWAAGPLRSDGTFDLTNKSRKRLRGRLGTGRFYAEWVDPRHEGRFEGTMEGRRR